MRTGDPLVALYRTLSYTFRSSNVSDMSGRAEVRLMQSGFIFDDELGVFHIPFIEVCYGSKVFPKVYSHVEACIMEARIMYCMCSFCVDCQ